MNAATTSSPCLTHRAHRARGFVLIYVLGAVVLLSAVVLGASLSMREQTAAVIAHKQRLQTEQSLRGALHTAIAKIALDIEIAQRKPNDSRVAQALSPRYASWTAGWALQTLQQADEATPYGVQVIPAEWLPDANLLVQDDWQRLFEAWGVPPEIAQHQAQQVLTKRGHLLRLGSSRGFTHWDQVLSALTLAPELLYGRADGTSSGVLDVLVLGTGKRGTDPNQTPLLIYRALYNASDDRLNRLMRLRAAGSVTAAQEAEVLGLLAPASAAPAAANAAANAPRMFRVVVTPPPSATPSSMTMKMMAMVSVQAGQVNILHEYLFFQ